MIGDRIRAKRIAADMTQGELATVLGVSPAAVGMYEQNRRSPGQKVLKKLCLLWNVTADYLLYGHTLSDNPPESPLRVEEFLGQLREELTRQKGLMFEFDGDGRRHILTDDEVEQLYDAMRVGAEVALRARKP